MKDFFQSWKFKIIVCIFALVFGFMIYAAIAGNNIIFPRSILETITQPFSNTATSISDWVESTLDTFINAQKYKKENIMLRETLNDLYEQIRDKEEVDEENSQLREMLDIAEKRPDYEWSAPCSVIARSANDIYGGFTIDKGTSDGIELHDPVFTSIGLVGVVTEVSSNYSVVTSILSTEVTIGAISTNTDAVGIIENDIKYSIDGYCLMGYVNKNSGIEVGEPIVTSGGSIFPSDLLIGTVKEIITDPNGLTLDVVIEPAENVLTVTNVFVITSFKGQGAD